MALLAPPQPGFADPGVIRRLERAENFPVALRLLPRRLRRDLRAVYAAARFIDDVGDDPALAPVQRLGRLRRLDADLHAVARGDVVGTPALDGLRPLLTSGRVDLAPFLALVEANRLDQRRRRYPSYADLRHYCSLSADPVGRIVLGVFAVGDERARALSDDVCTALQILEHCQDVGEDKKLRDRVYLPQEDLACFGLVDDDLDAGHADLRLRALIGYEVDGAEELLASGTALVALLRGWARIAVAGYVAGGRATVDAIRRADFDVLAGPPRPRRRDVLAHLMRLLRGAA